MRQVSYIVLDIMTFLNKFWLKLDVEIFSFFSNTNQSSVHPSLLVTSSSPGIIPALELSFRKLIILIASWLQPFFWFHQNKNAFFNKTIYCLRLSFPQQWGEFPWKVFEGIGGHLHADLLTKRCSTQSLGCRNAYGCLVRWMPGIASLITSHSTINPWGRVIGVASSDVWNIQNPSAKLRT